MVSPVIQEMGIPAVHFPIAVPFEEDEWPRFNRRPDPKDDPIIHLPGLLPEGYYTVPMRPYGTTVTLRVVHTAYPPEKDRGTKTIGWLEHGTGSMAARYFAFVYEDMRFYVWPEAKTMPPYVVEALQELLCSTDPIEYGEEYAKGTGICWRCGKPLSREQSITRGVGPICWQRLGGGE